MHYPSKLLLFGEYLIIQAGEALATPFQKYGGKWNFAPNDPSLQQNLSALIAYLFDLQKNEKLICKLDLERFLSDLKRGLFFDSSIPSGYGLGSSGALCAGIYDRYCIENKILPKDTEQYGKLKTILAQIESFFHGESSGIDPLVSYTKQAIYIKTDKSIEAVQLSDKSPKFSFFLLDTSISRQTAPLVDLFLEKCSNLDFTEKVKAQFIPVSNKAILSFLQNDEQNLLETFQEISLWQYTHFSEMIPEAFRCIWREGLEEGHFYLKLCGAGGGGFLLGLSVDLESTERALEGFSVQSIA